MEWYIRAISWKSTWSKEEAEKLGEEEDQKVEIICVFCVYAFWNSEKAEKFMNLKVSVFFAAIKSLLVR